MKHSEQLERETEQTRAEIERTLEELRTRISPGQMVDQLMDYARTGTAADFLRNLGRRTVDNPLPLAVMGAGLAWLILANGRDSRSAPGGPSLGQMAEAGRSTASRVSDTARAAASSASDFAHRVRSHIGSDRSEPQLGQTEARRGSVLGFLSEHPVALVGLGLALGAAFGAAITPAVGTRREDGEVKDRLGRMGEAMHGQSQHAEEHAAKERVAQMGETSASATRTPAGERGNGAGETARPDVSGPL